MRSAILPPNNRESVIHVNLKRVDLCLMLAEKKKHDNEIEPFIRIERVDNNKLLLRGGATYNIGITGAFPHRSTRTFVSVFNGRCRFRQPYRP